MKLTMIWINGECIKIYEWKDLPLKWWYSTIWSVDSIQSLLEIPADFFVQFTIDSPSYGISETQNRQNIL